MNNMKNIVIIAVLITTSIGLLTQQTVAQPLVHELRNDEQVVRISARDFEFTPNEIVVRKGVPVVLELISKDRRHGFTLARFHLRTDMTPGIVEKVRFVPD